MDHKQAIEEFTARCDIELLRARRDATMAGQYGFTQENLLYRANYWREVLDLIRRENMAIQLKPFAWQSIKEQVIGNTSEGANATRKAVWQKALALIEKLETREDDPARRGKPGGTDADWLASRSRPSSLKPQASSPHPCD